jgi:hypothetical protein
MFLPLECRKVIYMQWKLQIDVTAKVRLQTVAVLTSFLWREVPVKKTLAFICFFLSVVRISMLLFATYPGSIGEKAICLAAYALFPARALAADEMEIAEAV